MFHLHPGQTIHNQMLEARLKQAELKQKVEAISERVRGNENDIKREKLLIGSLADDIEWNKLKIDSREKQNVAFNLCITAFKAEIAKIDEEWTPKTMLPPFTANKPSM